MMESEEQRKNNLQSTLTDYGFESKRHFKKN